MSSGSTCCFRPLGTSRSRHFWVSAQPAFSRLSGHYTHVTLHHLMDNINLADSGIRFPRALSGGRDHSATRMLLMANSISVLLPVYRRTLIEKYRGENVHFRAHGILGGCPEPPDFASRGNPEHRILAFGKWGTYKRLELLLEAFQRTLRRNAECSVGRCRGKSSRDPGIYRVGRRKHERQSAYRIYRICGRR